MMYLAFGQKALEARTAPSSIRLLESMVESSRVEVSEQAAELRALHREYDLLADRNRELEDAHKASMALLAKRDNRWPETDDQVDPYEVTEGAA
ncbi:MAG: hypothetical protein ACTHZ9_11240 [Leucobacter sp.]